jgi:subtilase family serine protease
MTRRFWRAPLLALAIVAASAVTAQAAIQAPGTVADPTTAGTAGTPCTADGSIHCYTPQEIAAAYGVDALHASGTLGEGQTIVLVDSYGTPTGAQDLQTFHDTFYPNLPDPDFTAVYPNGHQPFKGCHGNGTGISGPCAAEGWAGEANLDIEWAYAMAPKAHIVLIGVPPAETLGVQGLPNLFKAISDAIDTYPAGTVFSMSFGFPEQDFPGNSAAAQTRKYDAVFQKGLAKGDTFFASSGDDGTTGTAKQQHETRTFDEPTVGWPASSPYVTAVGGTQLQYGWTWDPTSDVPYLADGSANPAYFAATQGGNTEPVWNESFLPAATGGGPSVIYPRPSWQDSVAGRITDADGAQVDARGVPDLSWNAAVNGGVLVYTSFFPEDSPPAWHIYGGTSASSPQVAGVVALANEQQREAGEPPIGYLNPLLYEQVNGAGLRDVVPMTYGTAISGQLVNNRLFDYNGDGQAVTPGPVPGHPVLAGWDETTGFGSPQGASFVAAIRAARNANP